MDLKAREPRRVVHFPEVNDNSLESDRDESKVVDLLPIVEVGGDGIMYST
jgi:hypothetical protein